MMNERLFRRVQKNRHMNEILLMIASNSIFKNLNNKDRKKLAALIYKAESIEMYIRNKNIMRVNTSFQQIIAAAMAQMDLNDDDEDEDEDEDFK